MTNTLKPCPFCGGAAQIDRMGASRVSMQIRCEDCGASMETGETWIDEHSSWNTRTVIDPEQQTRDNLEQHNEEVKDNAGKDS